VVYKGADIEAHAVGGLHCGFGSKLLEISSEAPTMSRACTRIVRPGWSALRGRARPRRDARLGWLKVAGKVAHREQVRSNRPRTRRRGVWLRLLVARVEPEQRIETSGRSGQQVTGADASHGSAVWRICRVL
jgi:hypothetical protein